jgi:hypothetical protein
MSKDRQPIDRVCLQLSSRARDFTAILRAAAPGLSGAHPVKRGAPPDEKASAFDLNFPHPAPINPC